MTILKKQSVFFLLALLCFQPFSMQAKTDLEKTLWCVGGALIGLTAGAIAYNACATLSDDEEINRAQILCNKATERSGDLRATYKDELTLLAHTPINASVSKRLTRMINRRGHSILIFLDFKTKLDHAINTANCLMRQINKKQRHLRKRQRNLSTRKNRETMPASTQYYYQQQYETLLNNLRWQKRDIQNLHHLLQELRSAVLCLKKYDDALMLNKINRLERKLDRLQDNRYCTPYESSWIIEYQSDWSTQPFEASYSCW